MECNRSRDERESRKRMSTIVEKIGVPALLEQTAEECCELAQACLKMARKLRDENPTPKSVEDIRDNLVEEMADVEVCLSQIMFTTDITSLATVVTPPTVIPMPVTT